MNKQRVFNFSGGRTSAYMVIHYWQPGDIVLFCDTGREHPKTYKFINDFEAFENISIIRLGGKTEFTDYLAKRNFEEILNRVKRSCTIELKIKPARRYIRSLGLMRYENIIGFRYDEPLHRFIYKVYVSKAYVRVQKNIRSRSIAKRKRGAKRTNKKEG